MTMLRLRALLPLLRARLYTLAPRCPSCSSPLPTPLPACPTCSYISAVPASTSFYEIFQLPDQPNPFRIDVSALRTRFRQAQAICHPDSWTAKGVHKKDIAQSLSTLVNEAYQGLSRPVSRAEYILERNGYKMSETEQLDDVQFISEVMEAREELEDANDRDSVEKLVKANSLKVEQTVLELEELVGTKAWEQVKAAAVRLKYLQGIEQTANEKLRDL